MNCNFLYIKMKIMLKLYSLTDAEEKKLIFDSFRRFRKY